MAEVPNPYLEVRQGVQVLQRVEIPVGGEVVAGRTNQCQVVVAHASVSRMHVRFLREGHTVTLEDLGSANGTFLDGEQVTKQVTMTDGRVLQLGQKTAKDPILIVFHDPASRLLREMGLLPAGDPAPPPAQLARPAPTEPVAKVARPAPSVPPPRPPQPAAEPRSAEPDLAPPPGSDGAVVEVVPARRSRLPLFVALGAIVLVGFLALVVVVSRVLRPASTLWTTVQVTPTQVSAGTALTLQSPDIAPAKDLVVLFAGTPLEQFEILPGRVEAILPRLADRGAGRYEVPLVARRGEIDVFQATLQYQVVPEIEKLPARAAVGEVVEIGGSGLSERRNTIKVFFGETEGEVVETRLDRVLVRVPMLTRTDEVVVPVRVRVGTFEATATGRVTVGPRAPNPLPMVWTARALGEGGWEVSHPLGRAFVVRRGLPSTTGEPPAELSAELRRLDGVFARAAAEPSLRFELRQAGGRFALVARSSVRGQAETVVSWSAEDLAATAAAAGTQTPPEMVAYWLAGVANDFLDVFGRGKALGIATGGPAYQVALDALVAQVHTNGGAGRPEPQDVASLDPAAREEIGRAFFAMPSGWGRVAGDWHFNLENIFDPEEPYEVHLVVRLVQRDRTLSGNATISFRGGAVEYGIPDTQLNGRLEPGLPPRVRLEGTFNRPVGRLILEGELGPDGLVGTFTASLVRGQGDFRGLPMR